MIVWNHRWLWKSYIKMNGPHFCSQCGTQLEKVKRVEILENGSELRQELDRIYGVTDHMWGRAKYHWTEFRCPGCGARYTIDAVKRMEEKYNGQ